MSKTMKNCAPISTLHRLAILMYLFFSTVPRVSSVSTSEPDTTDLVKCATKAFAHLGDASKRIVCPSSDTYTDARTGEKIK